MKDTKDVVSFGCHMIKAIESSLEDGKISISDIIHFKSVLPKLAAAVSGIQNVKGEIESMNAEQMGNLVLYVKQEFDLKDNDLEFFIENIIDIVCGMIEAIKNFKELKNVS